MRQTLYSLLALCLLLSSVSNSKAEQPPQKPWQITISAGFGFNDNVPRLDSRLTLAANIPGITKRESALARLTFDGQYDLIRSSQHILTAGYNVFAGFFLNSGGLDNFNFVEHSFWGGYQKKLGTDTVGSFKLSDRYTTYGGDGVRNSIILEPALIHRVNNHITVELNGLWAFNDYKVPLLFGGAPAANQDGEIMELSPVIFFSAPNFPVQGHLRYRYGLSQTQGGAFNYNENAISPGVSAPLFWKIEAELIYWRIWREYDGLGPTLNSKRQDNIDLFQVHTTRPISHSAHWYVDYEHTNAKSNANGFEYNQNVLTSGILMTF